jgi:hypothetical protein
VTIALISKPGITGASTLAIPKNWDPHWFRDFIINQLKGADVRNATSPTGTIKIGGNISSPYGTLDLNTAANFTFTGDIIINPVSGTPLTVKFNNTSLFVVGANGLTAPILQGFGPTAGGLVDMTVDSGTFTATITGFAAPPTGTATWFRIGKLVILFLPTITGTSNSTSMTMTGLPAVIQPPTLSQFCPCLLQDNTTNVLGFGLVNAASGTITFTRGVVSGTAVTSASTGFTAAGTKGVNDTVLVYQLT